MARGKGWRGDRERQVTRRLAAAVSCIAWVERVRGAGWLEGEKPMVLKDIVQVRGEKLAIWKALL